MGLGGLGGQKVRGSQGTHLQEVGGGFGQLSAQELELFLVKSALQMGVHFIAVEGAVLTDRAGKHEPVGGGTRAGGQAEWE